MAEAATFDFREDERASVLALRGDWTVDTISGLERGLAEVSEKLKAGAVVTSQASAVSTLPALI